MCWELSLRSSDLFVISPLKVVLCNLLHCGRLKTEYSKDQLLWQLPWATISRFSFFNLPTTVLRVLWFENFITWLQCGLRNYNFIFSYWQDFMPDFIDRASVKMVPNGECRRFLVFIFIDCQKYCIGHLTASVANVFSVKYRGFVIYEPPYICNDALTFLVILNSG